jgi:hypothetical protein
MAGTPTPAEYMSSVSLEQLFVVQPGRTAKRKTI